MTPMTPMTPTTRTFRVTVRGRFSELSAEARHYLVATQDEHDIFKSEFSREGTFTYDSRIDFFNLRYEVRLGDGGSDTEAAEQAITEAGHFLRTLHIGHRDLKATVMDMSAMWDRVERTRQD
jgi:Family of unknown function (DUF6204)